MARILLIGGHGKVALLVEPILTGRGDTVTAVIRNPEQEDEVRATGAEPLVADVEALDTTQLSELVAGHDAIVWSAGSGGASAQRTWAVDRDAAVRSIDAAAAAGVTRYVMVSYFGAGPDHGVSPDDPFYAYAEAKSAADEHLQGTALDWTIIAPSALTLDPPTGRIDASAPQSGSVPRGDVAAVIAAVLADDATVGRTVRFNSGDVPIAEAIAG